LATSPLSLHDALPIYDEAQVAADEQGTGLFAFFHLPLETAPFDVVEVWFRLEAGGRPAALLDGAGEADLVFGGQEAVVGDIVEVEADCVGGSRALSLRSRHRSPTACVTGNYQTRPSVTIGFPQTCGELEARVGNSRASVG